MKFIKKIFLLILLAYISINAKYISVVTMISGNGFKSLQAAFDNEKSNIKALGLTISELNINEYHMTISGFNLGLPDTVLQANKKKLLQDIQEKLKSASDSALEEVLELKKTRKPISLNFSHIELFNSFVVAIFKTSPNLETLIQKIEENFKKIIQPLIKDGIITTFQKHYEDFKPHISLSKITSENNHIGKKIYPKTKISNFVISRSDSIIEAQWRKKDIPQILTDYKIVNLATSLSSLKNRE